LKAVIKVYEAEYETALPEDKRQLLQVIIATSQNLNLLLDERTTAATAGISSWMSMYLYYYDI
jgi:hypothetical protein